MWSHSRPPIRVSHVAAIRAARVGMTKPGAVSDQKVEPFGVGGSVLGHLKAFGRGRTCSRLIRSQNRLAHAPGQNGVGIPDQYHHQ